MSIYVDGEDVTFSFSFSSLLSFSPWKDYRPSMTTPRLFIIRHGETEWSLNGRHTGTTELPLTANGERRIIATGKALVGDDRLIVPSKLAHMSVFRQLSSTPQLIIFSYVSPRHRAQRTLELLGLCCRDAFPWQDTRGHSDAQVRTEAKVQIEPDVREWDYGDYEGLTSKQIHAQLEEKGGDGKWDIWQDGCPGGESPSDVEKRLDRVIADIRNRWHKGVMDEAKKGDKTMSDVLVVAHGHILRALAMRWAGKSLHEGPVFLLEAGGVGTLRYVLIRLLMR